MKTFLLSIRRIWHRFQEDHCLLHASDIAFATLFALIPLLVLAFSFLETFGKLHIYQDALLRLLYRDFLLQSDPQVQEQLNLFFEKGFNMDLFGLAAFVITSVLWLRTIEASLNTIQRVTKPPPFWSRLPTYWTLLTLTPLAMVASFYLTYFLADTAGDHAMLTSFTTHFLPFFISCAAIFILYKLIPYHSSSLLATISGTLFTAILWALAKKSFLYYSLNLANYSKLYGVFGAIFSFLLWTYITWAIFLLGAEVIRELDEPTTEGDLADL